MPFVEEVWKRGLCGCYDSHRCLCCVACVAPCVPYYANVYNLKDDCCDARTLACIHGAAFYAGIIAPPSVYCCTNTAYATVPACLLLVPCVMQCVTRGNIRTDFNIKGDCCEDACTVLCCYSCALVQEGVEMDHLELPTEGVNSMQGKQSSPVHVKN